MFDVWANFALTFLSIVLPFLRPSVLHQSSISSGEQPALFRYPRRRPHALACHGIEIFSDMYRAGWSAVINYEEVNIKMSSANRKKTCLHNNFIVSIEPGQVKIGIQRID
jgi:hypothetical protein